MVSQFAKPLGRNRHGAPSSLQTPNFSLGEEFMPCLAMPRRATAVVQTTSNQDSFEEDGKTPCRFRTGSVKTTPERSQDN